MYKKLYLSYSIRGEKLKKTQKCFFKSIFLAAYPVLDRSPAVSVRKVEYTLDRVSHSHITQRDRKPFMLTFTGTSNWDSPINLTSIYLVCGGKREHGNVPCWKSSADSNPLWGDSSNQSTTVCQLLCSVASRFWLAENAFVLSSNTCYIYCCLKCKLCKCTVVLFEPSIHSVKDWRRYWSLFQLSWGERWAHPGHSAAYCRAN